jgi:GT2 family glycosyltransferase
MTIDVVVVAYRSAAHLRTCVEPLAGEEDLRVIVVDNACPENSAATVADLPIELAEMGRNAGFAAACNAGARRGSGEGILFLNPDAVMTPADVRVLAAAFEADRSLAAVAPRIVAPTGETERSMFREPRLASSFGEAFFLHHVFRDAQWATEQVRTGYDRFLAPEALIGAVLLVRRSTFERVGGFDEAFFLYCEDIDLCTRLRRAGFTLLYEPAATARHARGGSTPAGYQAALRAEARIVYARLHSRGLRYGGFRLACALHEAARLPVAALRSTGQLRARAGAVAVALGRSAPRPGAGEPGRRPGGVRIRSRS